jgi:hypothetical protein
MYNTRRRNSIQYAYITYLMSIKTLYVFPTADIQYPIKSGERIASYRSHIDVFNRPIEYTIFN